MDFICFAVFCCTQKLTNTESKFASVIKTLCTLGWFQTQKNSIRGVGNFGKAHNSTTIFVFLSLKYIFSDTYFFQLKREFYSKTAELFSFIYVFFQIFCLLFKYFVSTKTHHWFVLCQSLSLNFHLFKCVFSHFLSTKAATIFLLHY